MAKGQLAQAERTLQRAIYTAHYFLGQLYWEIGKADATEREMKIAHTDPAAPGTERGAPR